MSLTPQAWKSIPIEMPDLILATGILYPKYGYRFQAFVPNEISVTECSKNKRLSFCWPQPAATFQACTPIRAEPAWEQVALCRVKLVALTVCGLQASFAGGSVLQHQQPSHVQATLASSGWKSAVGLVHPTCSLFNAGSIPFVVCLPLSRFYAAAFMPE